MEIGLQNEEPNNNCRSHHRATKQIDKINNNISSLLENLCENSTKIDADESSLPSPKAMLETIMPCEKLCNSFRQIADEIGAGEVLKTHIKHEMSEPKLASDTEDYEHEQFPLNLKALKHGIEMKHVSLHFFLNKFTFEDLYEHFSR
jgi:Mg2+ and Co2+ transporter CorA